MTDNGDTANKRIRMDGEASDNVSVSRVLCLRDLPSDTTEYDAVNLASPFGPVSSVIFNKKGLLALLELCSESQAVTMVNFYKKVCPARIRGRGPVVVDYSKYPSLTNAVHGPAITEAIHSAKRQWSLITSDPDHHKVLHVQVDNAPHAKHFSYHHYLLAFSPFGEILRIVSFKTGMIPKAFIEFSNSVSTCVAKVVMNGAPLFTRDVGACLLHTDFSHQATIEVHQEDANCRDFTHNPLSEVERSELVAWASRRTSVENSNCNSCVLQRHLVSPQARALLDLFTEETLSLLDVSTLCLLANRLIPPLVNASLAASLPQASVLKSQADMLDHLQSVLAGSNCIDVRREDFSTSILSPVVYVCNLNVERVTPDTLFTLFGVYGDVQRVKIMWNKSDAALVQLSDSGQAQLAVNHLNGVPLYGNILRCSISKNHSITLTTIRRDSAVSGSDEDGPSCHSNTRDYTQQHRLHRFRLTNSRNMQNVCAPCKFLHVSNLPEPVSEDDVKGAFECVSGCNVLNVKIIRLTKPMALIQLEDLEKAVEALIALHDHEISPGVHIRVSFSKTIPRG